VCAQSILSDFNPVSIASRVRAIGHAEIDRRAAEHGVHFVWKGVAETRFNSAPAIRISPATCAAVDRQEDCEPRLFVLRQPRRGVVGARKPRLDGIGRLAFCDQTREYK